MVYVRSTVSYIHTDIPLHKRSRLLCQRGSSSTTLSTTLSPTIFHPLDLPTPMKPLCYQPLSTHRLTGLACIMMCANRMLVGIIFKASLSHARLCLGHQRVMRRAGGR